MTNKNKLVSIIMNCFNSDKFLREAIDSVYSQTFLDWEIIFWDNASTDDSAKIAKSYDQRIKYYRSDKTTSLGEARKLAMNKATGKYISFLDCDDLYLRHKVRSQINLMENSNYAMCYGSAIHISENGKVLSEIFAKYKSGFIFPKLLERYEINMQSVMVRRNILENNDITFSTNLKYCPDHNLFMEIASRFEVGVINECIVKYRIVSNSLSNRTIHLAASEIKYTLDAIHERDPVLSEKYKIQFSIAYDKLNYYRAVNLICKHDFKGARKCLEPVVVKKWEYAILYIMLLFNLPNKFVLKILNR